VHALAAGRANKDFANKDFVETATEEDIHVTVTRRFTHMTF